MHITYGGENEVKMQHQKSIAVMVLKEQDRSLNHMKIEENNWGTQGQKTGQIHVAFKTLCKI